MIVDFDNPVSVQYMNKSIQSFTPVKDILSITPVQCTTPNTLPIRYKKNYKPIPFYVGDDGIDFCRPRFFGGTFDDNSIYQSIMHSQYTLIKRMAQGESDIAIMEHDAALVNEESFRAMYSKVWGEVDGYFPGACMEFYRFSQSYSKWFIDLLDNFPYTDYRFSGPMGVISTSVELGWKSTGDWLLPCKEVFDEDAISYGAGIVNQLLGKGKRFKPATKQFYCTGMGNTNLFDYSDVVGDLSKEDYDLSNNGPMRRDFVLFDEF
tara:strand:- start:4447 stop:5238 length:792 start_codon:yes stop_codon:yes gene_type:complete